MPSLIQWYKPVLLLWEEFLISWYFTGTHPHHRRIPMSDFWMWTLLRNKTQEVPFWSSVASMVKKSMTRDVKSKTTCLSACCAVMVWRSLKLARGMPPEYSNRSSLRNTDILVLQPINQPTIMYSGEPLTYHLGMIDLLCITGLVNREFFPLDSTLNTIPNLKIKCKANVAAAWHKLWPAGLDCDCGRRRLTW